MLVAIGDTHRTTDHGLAGRTLEAVRSATVVCHTGDFTTATVYERVAAECETLHAVYGNNDDDSLRSRLPRRTVFEAEGVTVALVHGHEHSAEALSFVGREAAAELVVYGHSHRPGVTAGSAVTLVNPGSHAEPRWHRPAHAEFEPDEDGVEGRLVEPSGTVFERFRLTTDTPS